MNHGHQGVLANTGHISASQLTEPQRRIVDRLVETGQWNVLENVLETSATLATLFGVDAKTIRRDLNALQSKGVIRRDGPDRGGHRVILKKIEPSLL
ncbi:MAG: DeoR family transcriptional regulator [Prevotella sp.]|nr:DeoR family transcriptional regulator [Prevotella sp.]